MLIIEQEDSQWPMQSGRKRVTTRSLEESAVTRSSASLTSLTSSLDNSEQILYTRHHLPPFEQLPVENIPMAFSATNEFSERNGECNNRRERMRTRRKTDREGGGGGGGDGGGDGGGQRNCEDTKNRNINHQFFNFTTTTPHSDNKIGKKTRMISSCKSSILVIFVIVLVNLVCSANCSSDDHNSVEENSFTSFSSDNNTNVNYNSPLASSFSSSSLPPSQRTAQIYSNHFAVHVPAGEQRANEIASSHGFVNTGQIGSLKNYYLFEHSRIRKRSVDPSHEHHNLLSDEPDVSWFEQQVEKKRVKRDFQYYDGAHGGTSGGSGAFFGSPSTHSYVSPYQSGNGGFPDPLWKEQWYLTGGSKDGFDMNVQVAWKRGYTGKGVTVSILDDGIQTNHPDLVLNYDPRASTDINDNDNDPYPQDNGDNKHGTRCAGEVAATAGNNICGVGVAYNASIGGVRMLDGTVNDAVEAKALGLNPDHVDIFSASWGPEDDGKTVDGPGPLARRAFIYGVTNGRRGLGSIFIWASGNGGRHVDSCNCDGYTNSIFTLSISSATQGGYKPWYLEECSSTLATTYSSGTPTLDKSVATVDMDGRLRPDHICTVEHTGTSASAPLAAGIAALALEANPNLSWRDLQHLVVLTSRPDPLEKEEGWYVNGVQRKFSHKFGYGLMDAGKMVDLAVDWAGVPPQHICKSREIREDREVPGSHLGKVKVFMDVDGCAGTNSEIRYLEHVQCKISLRFFPRGNLRILLTSPMGTTSVLLFERPRDVSSSNFDDWPFLSVHYWGEQAHGRWTLEIINSGSRRINQPGMLKKWQLILYGTDVNPIRLKSRSLQLPHHAPSASGLASGASVPTGQYHDPGQTNHPSYRAIHPSGPSGESTQLPPRFVSQDYLFSSASEPKRVVHNEQKKMHSVRSQCQNEYWIKDLAICVNDCPDGYFEDPKVRECLSCPQRCKSCYNATSCTACEHNLVLFETECVARCPEGHYEADSSCERCPVKDCQACAGPMGQECVQCAQGMYLDEGQCVPTCGTGKRPSKVNGECIQCQSGCQRCGDQGYCLECYPGFQITENGKLCQEGSNVCPRGMYLGNEGQCLGCGDLDCLRCHAGQQCLECREGMMVKRGRCVQQCGEGFYQSVGNKECFRCASLCTKCTGEGGCVECRADGMLQEGRCLPHCPNGYFNDAGTCVTCSSACLTCIGPKDNECVTCDSGRRLTKLGTCAPLELQQISASSPAVLYTNGSCSDGAFYDYSASQCRDCHRSCSRCTGAMPYQCRACRYPLRLDRGSSRCIPCCRNENSEDCCHCDEKRHSTSSPYNGECHFVSRRVSESEEREISSGTLSDKVVLMSFWFTVFVLVLAVIIVFQRNKRGKHRRGGDVSSSMNYFNSSSSLVGSDDGSDSSALLVNSSSKSNGRSSSSWRHLNNGSNNVKYTPVNLNDGGDYIDEDDDDEDEEYYNQQFSNQYPNHRQQQQKHQNKNENAIINSKSYHAPPNYSNGRRRMLEGIDDEDEIEFEHILDSQQSEGVPLVLKT